MRRTPNVSAISLVCLLASGCGSTVQMQSTVTTDIPSVAGSSAMSATDNQSNGTKRLSLPGAASGWRSPTGAAIVTGLSGGGASAATGNPVGLGVSAAQTPGTAGAGLGYTKSTIYLGVSTSDANTYAKSLGIQAVDGGDTLAQYQAIVTDIDHHGGIDGRQIQLVVHQFSTAQSINDPGTANQAACTDWTQDHHVAAVLDGGSIIEGVLLNCLANARTPLIDAGGIDAERLYSPTYARYPLFFNIADMLGETYDRISVGRLVERGFFQQWNTATGGPGSLPVKIGMLMPEGEFGDEAVASITRQLARYGLKPFDVVRLSPSFSQGNADSQNAELKFRAEGITHIVTNPGLAFMETAQQEGYFPRYFLPTALQVYAQTAPAAQLNGAMAEDYIPAEDVAATDYPGDPTAASVHCRKVMTAAGQAPSSGSILWAMQFECDEFYFVQEAARAVGGLSTGSGFARGFDALGSRVQSAVTWYTFIDAQHRASALSLRDLSFESGCSCWRYISTRDYG